MARKFFLLRISPELYKSLEHWAQDEMRSVNGQIEFLLRQVVKQRRKEHPDDGQDSDDEQ